jgi:hypothetical protein
MNFQLDKPACSEWNTCLLGMVFIEKQAFADPFDPENTAFQ